MVFLQIFSFFIGLFIVGWTIVSAIKSFVMPRGVNVWLVRAIFQLVGVVFRLRTRWAKTYEERDNVWAFFAPLALVLMPVMLLSLVLVGYMFLFWAVQPMPLADIFKLSGSSLLTLGYASVDDWPHKLLEFSEAMLGLILVALLIAYLPTIYSAFSRRETAVAMLEAYAGQPPSAKVMILRAHRIGELAALHDVWMLWQIWFAEIEESHTSLAPLSFFRSPQSGRSWVTAAGTVLDAAAITLSTVDVPWDAQAAVCIRNGYLALRSIATFFRIPFNPDPNPDDPISISQEEFIALYDDLAADGIPVRADREQAWRDFSGWRVNYDAVLLGLADMIMAPYALWVSDRSALPVREK